MPEAARSGGKYAGILLSDAEHYATSWETNEERLAAAAEEGRQRDAATQAAIPPRFEIEGKRQEARRAKFGTAPKED